MKRNLFNELKEGFTALESAREGKITLRQHGLEKKPALTITPGRDAQSAGEAALIANRIRQIFAHKRTHIGELGTRPSQSECPSCNFDPYG